MRRAVLSACTIVSWTLGGPSLLGPVRYIDKGCMDTHSNSHRNEQADKTTASQYLKWECWGQFWVAAVFRFGAKRKTLMIRKRSRVFLRIFLNFFDSGQIVASVSPGGAWAILHCQLIFSPSLFHTVNKGHSYMLEIHLATPSFPRGSNRIVTSTHILEYSSGPLPWPVIIKV